MEEFVSTTGKIFERHGSKMREKGSDKVYDHRQVVQALKSNGVKLERIKDMSSRDKTWVDQVRRQYDR